jgi:hypothetical protein
MEKNVVSDLDDEVVDGLRAIRFSGLTDKMNREAAKIAMAMGFDKTASWIRKKPQLYQRLVVEGFMDLG